MNDLRVTSPDAARSRLRATVETIGNEIFRLAAASTADGDSGPAKSLRVSFSSLVDQLALGPEPEVRRCPVCDQIGMRAATRCGYCWTKLTPLDEPAGAVD